jgi:UDP-N-acetylglucosamine--dolichyl-phosphate N-acetylglucosaminephosphotransferase
MANPILFVPIIASFLIALFFLPSWIKRARRVGLTGKDMNKFDKREVTEAGGVGIVAGFIIGVLLYIAIQTFYFKEHLNVIELYSLITTILIVTFIGSMDDFLGWKIGLNKRSRIFWVLVAAIPLIVINAGNSFVNLPLINGVELGLIYPLIIIPLGIIGATTTFNFLAGFNGLEAGQGMIILLFLSFVAYKTGSPWLTVMGLCMVAPLLVFYFFNRFPAKILPGDSLTYPVGALIAVMAILGNFEKIALFIFIPYFLEIVLKTRGKLKKESFAIPQEDGSLELPYKRVYGLTHLSLRILKKFKKKVYEKDVVRLIFIFQIIICLIALIIFRGVLFG